MGATEPVPHLGVDDPLVLDGRLPGHPAQEADRAHQLMGEPHLKVMSNNMMATTAQGGDVTIMTEGGVTVDNANVVAADIEASNGVIHVIDAVILPN